MQLLDLGAHLHAQLGIEIGERLVEQEHLRVAHDGAAHGDALALAARELAGVAREQRGEPQYVGCDLHALVDLGLRRVAQLHREAHVGGHGHVRVERVVLEDHGHVALLGRHVVDDAVADADLAAADVLQARDHAQERGLAAARRAHQHHEFPVADIDRNAVQDLRGAERLAHAAAGYAGQRRSPQIMLFLGLYNACGKRQSNGSRMRKLGKQANTIGLRITEDWASRMHVPRLLLEEATVTWRREAAAGAGRRIG